MEKKYYVYKTTNLINGKIYIGQHASIDIGNDQYIGSGDIIKKAIRKYGHKNFKREILFSFDSLDEAYAKEKDIVTEEFLDREDTYNVRVGGVGMFGHTRKTKELLSKKMTIFWESEKGSDVKTTLSEKQKELWSNPEYKEHMVEKFNTTERNEKLSINLKKWIVEHLAAHKEKMNKINHDPEKIRKMVEKQIDRPKSKECRENISKAKIGKHIGFDNPNFKGCYITPYGKFNSLKATSDAIGNSVICVRDRCVAKNKNKVTKNVVIVDSKITIDMVGKTWNELGWGFEVK